MNLKKYFLVFSCFILFATAVFSPSTAYASEITKEAALIEKGIPCDIINRYSDTIIDQLYNELCVENRALLSVESSLLSEQPINRGQINSGMMAFDVILMVDTTSTSYGERIDQVLVMVANTWYYRPVICRTDSVAVNWDPSLFTFQHGSFSLNCYGKLNDGTVVLYDSTDDIAESEQGAIGYYVSLNEVLNSYVSVESLGMFILEPAQYIYKVSTGLSTSINADYVHSKNPLGIPASFDPIGTGLAIDMGALCDNCATGANLYYKK